MTALIIGICTYITVIELRDSYYLVEFISNGSIQGRHYVASRSREELLHRLLVIRRRAHERFADEELMMHIIRIDRDTYEKHERR